MISDLMLNLHIIPFVVLFLIGLILLVAAPVNYRFRSKKILTTPLDLTRYNEFERKILTWGAVLTFSGVIGFGIMVNVCGYNYTHTDINGNV